MCEKSSYEGPTEIESHLYRGHRSRRSLFDYHFQNIQTKLKKTTPNVSLLLSININTEVKEMELFEL